MKDLIRKIIIRFFLVIVFLGLITLLPAGTFDYWQVYLYITVLFIPMMFVLVYFLKNDPEFLERRIRYREKEKAQVNIQIIFTVTFISGFIISGLDRRFGWSDIHVPIVILTDAIILSGYLLIILVFKQNRYASRIVEVDENQAVITTGLYGIIRHPMYAGFLIMYIPTPVALGSWWGLIPMSFIIPSILLRILNEESLLATELPGYIEYCQKTRYRLIPLIW